MQGLQAASKQSSTGVTLKMTQPPFGALGRERLKTQGMIHPVFDLAPADLLNIRVRIKMPSRLKAREAIAVGPDMRQDLQKELKVGANPAELKLECFPTVFPRRPGFHTGGR